MIESGYIRPGWGYWHGVCEVFRPHTLANVTWSSPGHDWSIRPMTFYRLSIALLPIAVFDRYFSLLFFFPYFLAVTVLPLFLSCIFRMYFPLPSIFLSYRVYVAQTSTVSTIYGHALLPRCNLLFHSAMAQSSLALSPLFHAVFFIPNSIFCTPWSVHNYLPFDSVILRNSAPFLLYVHFVYFLVNFIFPVIITFFIHPSYVALIHSLIRPWYRFLPVV